MKKKIKKHKPFQSKELKNTATVVQTLLNCIRTNDLESFREVLVAHLITVNKMQLAKSCGIGRQTIYDWMDPQIKFNPGLSTVSTLISKIAV